MEYRQFGSAGLRVSAIGLGCNPFGNEVDAALASAIVRRAIELGITYFDTADSYFEGRSEDYLGQALHGHRHEVIVATKFGNRVGPGPNDQGGSRQHIMHACEASLRRLETDYIDVYQLHSPDRQTPIEETLRALDDLIRHGKVRYIGCSNLFDWEVVEAHWTARAAGLAHFASCQEFFNLLYRDRERQFVPMCQKYSLALIPYMPLAAAMLSGTYQRGVAPPTGTRGARRPTFRTFDSERNWSVQESLVRLCAERGWQLPRLALAWLLTRPQVPTVIAGADSVAHIEDNVAALDLSLSAEDLDEIDRLTLVDEDRTIAPIFRRQ